MFCLTLKEQRVLLGLIFVLVFGAGIRAATAILKLNTSVRWLNPIIQPSQTININTANISELEQLNGVGPKLAARIIAYRQSQGKLTSLKQLQEIKGFGFKKVEKLKDKIIF